jgi:hypothetical protein
MAKAPQTTTLVAPEARSEEAIKAEMALAAIREAATPKDAPKQDNTSQTIKDMPVSFTLGGITIEVDEDMPIDEGAGSPSKSTDLPFKDLYTQLFALVVATGKRQSAFFPLSYVQARSLAYYESKGTKQPKAKTVSDLKATIQQHYKDWQAKDVKRLAVDLQVVTRNGTEAKAQPVIDPKATEPGVRFWLKPKAVAE